MSVYYEVCLTVFEILDQKYEIREVEESWGYRLDGYFTDGFDSKEEAEIAALKKIIKEAKSQVD